MSLSARRPSILRRRGIEGGRRRGEGLVWWWWGGGASRGLGGRGDGGCDGRADWVGQVGC